MRVLVVPKWYPEPDRPVFGIFCREHARALALEHEVVVLASYATPRPGFPLYRLEEQQKGELLTIRLRYRRPRFRPAAMACQLAGMLHALWRLRRRGFSPDIVHAHVYSAALPALLLARLLRVPVVVTEHFTGFQRGLISGYDRLVARLAFRYADLVAPVSRDLERHVLELVPRARTRVLPNVVDTGLFRPPEEPVPARPAGRELRLLNVAALAEKKAHADLLEALALLRGRLRFRLEVVGEGPLLGALRRRSMDLGLDDAVVWLGERSPQEVARLMREADLFVLPSHFENQPVVLLEAMASGLPSVATSVGGVPEVLEGLGTLVAPGQPPELARALAGAAEALPEVDRQALRERAVERFGFTAVCARWSEVYRRLTARSGARPASPG